MKSVEPSRPSILCGLALNFLLLLLAGCAAQLAQIKAAPKGEGIAISVETQPEQAAIAIHDPAGIGGAEFTHTGGEFPGKVVFRLYLKGLENVQLVYGETLVEASLSSQPGHMVSQRLLSGEAAPGGETLQPGSPYWLEIEIVPQDGAEASIPLQSGYIQVEPPPDFYQQQPESWSLSWVDFYR